MSNTSLLGSFGGQAGDALMFRNRIINGDCLVAQRGVVAAVNNSATYGGADRFFVAPLGFTTVTGGSITKSALTEAVSGFGQWLASFSCTGSGTVVMGQRIESLNTLDLNSKAVTFSGILYHNVGSAVTVSIKINKANAVDNFTGVTQIGSTGSVSVPSGVATPFSLTVTLGSTDGNNGMSAEVTFTGLSNISSKSFAIGNLQLEAGPTATPFERRPYSVELGMCQRYTFVWRIGNFNYIGFGGMETASVCNVAMVLPQIMRAQPLLESFANPSSVQFEYSSGMATGFTAMQINALATSTSYRLQFTGGAGGVAGSTGAVRSQAAEVKLVIQAEL